MNYQNHLKKIASYDLEQLENMTVKDLKVLGKGIVPLSGRKANLIDRLIEVSKPYRPKATHNIDPEKSIYQTATNLKNLCLNPKYDDLEKRINWISQQVVQLVTTYQLRDLSPSTISYQSSLDIKKVGLLIDSFLSEDPSLEERLKNVFYLFSTQLNKAVEGHRKVAKEQRTKNLNSRKKNRLTVSAIETYAWARTVLQSPTNYRWELVAIALGLVTGRRSAELLCTAQFIPTDNPYKAIFKGQLKTSESRELTIPLLAPIDHIQSAMSFLESIGKRAERVGDVNRQFSMPLSRAFDPDKTLTLNRKNKTLESLQLANPLAAHNIGETDKNRKIHFHSTRNIYANVCDLLINDGQMATQYYLAQIMGHSEGDKDQTTAGAYNIINLSDVRRLSLDEFSRAVDERVPFTFEDLEKFVIDNR